MTELNRSHRLATILAADVVGYTRLIAADASATLTDLDAARSVFHEQVSRNGGRVVDTSGDSMLAVFATASGAVAAAIALRDDLHSKDRLAAQVRPMTFRIGLHLGEVIEKADGSVYGDGVNIAARLESLAEPGGVMMSATLYGALSDAMLGRFEFCGEHQLKNVDRLIQTYRFIQDSDLRADSRTDLETPNKAKNANVDGSVSAAQTSPRRARRGWRLLLGPIIGVIVITGVAAVIRHFWIERNVRVPIEAMPLALPDKPSIAVRPIEDDLDTDNAKYFADGLTADLIADLARISGLFVIGPRSSFAFRDRDSTIGEFAQELSVRYVLRGTVSGESDGVELSMRLVDVVDGSLKWQEDYDVSFAKSVDATTQIARDVATALNVNLTRAELGTKLKPATVVPQALHESMRGRSLFVGQTPQTFLKAIPHLERSVELDPGFSDSYAVLAAIYWFSLKRGWEQQLDMSSAELKALAQKNRDLALKEPTSRGLLIAAEMALHTREFEQAEALIGRATVLAPSNAQVRFKFAEILAFSGEHERAMRQQREASRLDPFDRSRQLYVRGIAQFGLEQYQLASEALAQALDLTPTAGRPAVFLAAALGHLERPGEAADALAPYLDQPWALGSVQKVANRFPFRLAGDRERLTDGLRRSGVLGK
jgi:class 3 adenylate cyclase/TolB-like protein/cytochrome c-type biogenesis protein CcmH/NrfG